MYYAGHSLIWPIFLLIFLAYSSGQQYSYTRDCNDQHYKEVQCVVHLVDCFDESFFTYNGSNTQMTAGEAHDIRIEPLSKTQGNSYQLSVDISWQTPPNNSTKLLKGFFLDIESGDQKSRFCFLFNVTGSNWTTSAISSSPRLHFSTENLFRFGQKYDVAVHSLPENPKKPRVAQREVIMPHNPRSSNLTNLLDQNCSQYSNPYASKWTAGFRRIVLHPLARTIQVEFVGAPAQYCFEQYEVRLLDNSGLELLHSDVVSVDQMLTEIIDNDTVYFGQYNFTNLELDNDYIPSVIAVERAADGRCLCPVYGKNPYDDNAVCSCIAADWRAVKLQKIESNNQTATNSTNPTKSPENADSSGWKIYLSLVGLILAILTCVAFLLIIAYRHYGARGKTVRIRFIQDRFRQSATSLPVHDGAQGKALLENTLSETPIAVNCKNNLNLLIVYSHDSPEHAEAVLALSDFLRDVFEFDVHLDIYDAEKIEMNLMDYLSSSVINADKVLIINSMGTSQRYQTKIQNVPEALFTIERNKSTPFDSLFVQQIDMVLQHHNIISVRFDFSHFEEVMMPLHGWLQYVLPGNLIPLLSALTASNLKNDSRLTNSNPALKRLTNAIEAQKAIIMSNPQWFIQTHHRHRVISRPSNINITQQMKLLPSISTPSTLSPENNEEIADKDQSIEVNVKVITENVPTEANFDQNPMTNDSSDSGVYDDSRMLCEELEEKMHMSNLSNNAEAIIVQPKPNFGLEGGKPREETLDSGMISDVDQQIAV